MRLYTLKHGDKFKIISHVTANGTTFAKGTDGNDAILTLLNIDGMYARCLYYGNIEFIEAYTDVVLIEDKYYES